jgi:hypothetical protein
VFAWEKYIFFSFGNIFLFVSIGGVLWVYWLGLAQALWGIECSINPANIGRICWERATFYRQPSLWLVAFALVFVPLNLAFSCIGLFHFIMPHIRRIIQPHIHQQNKQCTLLDGDVTL